jgi:N-acetylmuramoyl-L-alanine amidase
MVKIFIDPGHGGTDSGAVGNGLQEKNLTLQIAKRMQQLLLTYENVQVRLSRETDKSLSLRQRTDMANNWNADFLISVHINAGGGNGFETFIFPGVGGVTKRNQDILHAEVMKELDGVRDRGKKRADFHMLRESKMDAILTENLFIDNSGDAAKLKMTSIINKIAQGHVNGVVKSYGLRKKEVAKPAPAKPAPAPTAKPAPAKPAPAPTPKPTPAKPAPAPTAKPTPAKPAPAPTAKPAPAKPAPAPTAKPAPAKPAPAPTAKPAPVKPAPAPTPKPTPAKPTPTPTQPDNGGSALLDKAIVIGSYPDFASAELLAASLKAPIYTRSALPNGKVAKELYVVGGSTNGLQADKIISLTGKDRFEVAAAVAGFLNR